MKTIAAHRRLTVTQSLQFALGEWLMRLGLRLMPKGPSRNELTLILKSWGRYMHETVG